MREVVRVVALTPVPGAPEVIVGIVNLCGEILAVVDLRGLLGAPAHGLTDHARGLVLGQDRDELGVLADSADDLTRVPVDEILAPPAAVA